MSAHSAEECDALFAEYLNVGALERLVSLYDPQAILMQRDGTAATGRAAIRESLAGLLGMKPKIVMNVHKVVRAGDDLAVLYNDWSMSAAGPDGSSLSFTGKAIEIVRRQADGTWLFAVDDPFARG